MKKICFVVAIPGSAHSFLKDHIRELVKRYEVHLVANFPNEDSSKDFREMGVMCHQVAIERPISLSHDLKALFSLRALFRKERFDTVHSVTPKAGLLTAIAGWLADVKVRIHIFTGQVWATRKGLMRTLLKLMDKLIVTFDTHLLVDGPSQRIFLIEQGVLKEKNSRVLANGSIAGVKLERFAISEEVRERERHALGIQPDDVVFVFLGRLNHDKGIGELYEAFNRLAEECPKAKLVLYGMDEEGYEAKVANYPNLKRDENFFYPGLTNKPFDALQGGDVFVLPTWREGFGSSVIEAQALGMPVITSDAYGVRDASVPGETALRCGVNDPEGLYRCMKEYYLHPELRKRHGAAGRERVIRCFDCNVVTAAWLKFYEEIC